MSRSSFTSFSLLFLAICLQFVSGAQANFVIIDDHHDDDNNDKNLTADEIKRRRIARIIAASVIGYVGLDPALIGGGCLLALIAYFIYAHRKKKARARVTATMGAGYPFAPPTAYTPPPPGALGAPGYGPPPIMSGPDNFKEGNAPNQPFVYQQGPAPSQYGYQQGQTDIVWIIAVNST
ncbi:hypothetical protein DFH06DRAFT_1131819 [Mycena polygramma]|nr:hypothetical protein DFH06DRAFT_1131819 [Mycena polygramma]